MRIEFAKDQSWRTAIIASAKVVFTIGFLCGVATLATRAPPPPAAVPLPPPAPSAKGLFDPQTTASVKPFPKAPARADAPVAVAARPSVAPTRPAAPKAAELDGDALARLIDGPPERAPAAAPAKIARNNPQSTRPTR
jgi:hypothetical protein